MVAELTYTLCMSFVNEIQDVDPFDSSSLKSLHLLGVQDSEKFDCFRPSKRQTVAISPDKPLQSLRR